MQLVDKLTQIGFTEYESKVYVALLRQYPATGYQISKSSGVPRSMVYETLSRLHNRGTVLQTVEGRATLYRPLPPQMLLNSHEADHKQLVQSLRSGLDVLYETKPDERVWSISGRMPALTYAAQMIREADDDVYLVLTDQDLDLLRPDIEAACHREIVISTLLTGQGKLECGRVAYHPPLESELQELTDMLLVAIDHGETLIASAGTSLEMKATITRNPDLVMIARQFVWMELFTQRIYNRLGPELLSQLEPEDRQIFDSLKR